MDCHSKVMKIDERFFRGSFTPEVGNYTESAWRNAIQSSNGTCAGRRNQVRQLSISFSIAATTWVGFMSLVSR